METLADTWAFDGEAWTQIDDIGTGPVTGAVIADTAGRRPSTDTSA
jgi:hypothetical protein